MKLYFKKLIFLALSIFIVPIFIFNSQPSASSTCTSYVYTNGCLPLQQAFGPLQTGWSMGDLVRYTIYRDSENPNGLNMYYGLVNPPAGASDVFNLNDNTYNLYNALGYLYAGWACFNYSANYLSFDTWVNDYRAQGQNITFDENNNITNDATAQKGLLLFENNAFCKNTIFFPTKTSLGTPSAYGYVPSSGDTDGTFVSVTSIRIKHDTFFTEEVSVADYANAASSCGWCANTGCANYVLACWPSGQAYTRPFVCPTGQFFGARIAHILGAVVNDVPWAKTNSTESNALGGTCSFQTPLISGTNGTGTALPMIAVMNGGPYTITTDSTTGSQSSTAPIGMFQPSTAHFGSIIQYITNYLVPRADGSDDSNYLSYHFAPALSRLSNLASYKISSENLLDIVDEDVTAYDNGVIVAIQNNTGDALEIHQLTSQYSSPSPVIGTLSTGTSNYYLHTASLMYGITAPTSSSSGFGFTASNSVTPEPSNMIKIKDSSISNTFLQATYIQVLSATQLQNLYNAVNVEMTKVFGSSAQLNYDQLGLTYTAPTDREPTYIVVTNFDPMLNSSSALNVTTNQKSILNSYRIQAINTAEFYGKPYLLTLQINKENVGYGIQTVYKKDSSGNYIMNNGNYVVSGYSLSKGSPSDYVLYPSIVSSAVYTWQNYKHLQDKTGFSSIPMCMIPDTILNPSGTGKIKGLQAYYLIWLMSYAAAMTECSYNNAAFGNIFDVYDKVFNLFSSSNNTSVASKASKTISRMIVDQSGNLVSGKILELDNGISICGCDTWDSGAGFNQDIPILGLSSATEVNAVGAEYVNLMVQVGTPIDNSGQKNNFKALYGLPYGNLMLFSLPTASLTQGVTMTFNIDATSKMFQMIVTDKNGSVLAAPKIFLDTNLYVPTGFTVDFLPNPKKSSWMNAQSSPSQKSSWKSPQSIGKKADLAITLNYQYQSTGFFSDLSGSKYSLQYKQSNNKNSLKLKNMSKNKQTQDNSFITNLLQNQNSYNLVSVDMQNKALNSIAWGVNADADDITIYNFIIQQSTPNLKSSNQISLDISSALSNTTNFKIVIIPVDIGGSFIRSKEDELNFGLNVGGLNHFRVYLADENNNLLTNKYFKLSIPKSNKKTFSGNFFLYAAESNSTAFYVQGPTEEKQYFNFPAPLPSGYLNYVFVINVENVKKPVLLTARQKSVISKILAKNNLYQRNMGSDFITSLFSFNFNTNNYGFSFLTNPWDKSNNVSANILPIVQGYKNFKFMIVAVDKKNNPMFDFSKKQNIDHFEIYILDKNNNPLSEPIPMPLTSCYKIGKEPITALNVINDLGPVFNYGENEAAEGIQLTYPFILSFENLSGVLTDPTN